MKKNLAEMVECILSFYKTQKGLPYETRLKATAWTVFLMRYGHQPQTENERALAFREYDEGLQTQIRLLKGLPDDILEGEDLKKACIGYLSESAYLRLKAYYLENK